jgi:hypothetical protein
LVSASTSSNEISGRSSATEIMVVEQFLPLAPDVDNQVALGTSDSSFKLPPLRPSSPQEREMNLSKREKKKTRNLPK